MWFFAIPPIAGLSRHARDVAALHGEQRRAPAEARCVHAARSSAHARRPRRSRPNAVRSHDPHFWPMQKRENTRSSRSSDTRCPSSSSSADSARAALSATISPARPPLLARCRDARAPRTPTPSVCARRSTVSVSPRRTPRRAPARRAPARRRRPSDVGTTATCSSAAPAEATRRARAPARRGRPRPARPAPRHRERLQRGAS